MSPTVSGQLRVAETSLSVSERRASIQRRLDTRTKPPGSLGALEALALDIGTALDTDVPLFRSPQVFVFAADHGIAADGVSAFPADVTGQMVRNYLSGGAAINVLSWQYGLSLAVIDAGITASLPPHPALTRLDIAAGTRNFRLEPAMTDEQCARAIAAGKECAVTVLRGGSNALLLGEMGIGNTASSAMLLHKFTGWALEDCVGRGTGLDDAGLARKRQILDQAAQRCSAALSPSRLLAEYGGLEIAALTGAMLAAVDHRCILVIDGFTVSVAALLAIAMDPRVRSHCVFSHCSAEAGHRRLLEHLQAHPILDLGLRLGEGTGAALAWPLIDSTARLLSSMASFASARVSERSE